MEFSNLWNCNGIGLILNLFSALLLFFYGFPIVIDCGSFDKNEKAGGVQHSWLAKAAIVLLISGFFLQLIGILYSSHSAPA